MSKLRSFAFAVVLATVASGLGLGACNGVTVLNDSCSKASDCVLPYVCCNKPRLPDGRPLPYCEELRGCEDPMPFLVEGNPCGRVAVSGQGAAGAGSAECSEGLLCCPATLTCATPAACPAAPAPSGSAPPSLAPCSADPDCTAGEICCGINFSQRNGQCRSVTGCP